MQTELTVEIKNIYGNELIYPVCNTAKSLCSITGAKTFNSFTIGQLKSIGYTFITASTQI